MNCGACGKDVLFTLAQRFTPTGGLPYTICPDCVRQGKTPPAEPIPQGLSGMTCARFQALPVLDLSESGFDFSGHPEPRPTHAHPDALGGCDEPCEGRLTARKATPDPCACPSVGDRADEPVRIEAGGMTINMAIDLCDHREAASRALGHGNLADGWAKKARQLKHIRERFAEEAWSGGRQ